MVHRSKGFSAVELVIVIAIAIIMAAIIVPNLQAGRKSQVSKNTTDDIVALLNEARSRTLSSESSSQYGVHLQSTKATMFTGTTYTAGLSTNREVLFDPAATISWSLQGGGADVLFNRLVGDTSQYGTITLTVSGYGTTKTVTIVKTGLVSSN